MDIHYTSIFVPILAKDIEIPFQEEHVDYRMNDLVLIKMDKGIKDYAKFKSLRKHSLNKKEIKTDWKILDLCTDKEKTNILEITEKAQTYKPLIIETIDEYKLSMVVAVLQLSFDERTLLVTYTAESRIDFRELVKKLGTLLKKRIQMLHIGARDKAKIVGGFGTCGRKTCCSQHLVTLPRVTMDAARDQNIAFKGAENLTGVCGKLKCCLNYESSQYKELKKKFPRFGSKVKVSNEEFIVIGMDILNGKVKMKSFHTYVTMDLEEFNKQKGS
jgi:cell fate regulator YaaT (PSP1 superfamily)